MLEYGKAYLKANDRVVEAMTNRMSPGARRLVLRLAQEAAKAEEKERRAEDLEEAF